VDIRDLYLVAFDYYKLYLKQRTDSFNFFLVLSGLMVGAITLSLKESLLPVSLFLSFSLAVVSYCFHGLDVRTNKYSTYTREHLLQIYEQAMKSEFPSDVDFLMTSISAIKHKTEPREITMTQVFKIVFIVFFFAGCAGTIWSAIELFAGHL